MRTLKAALALLIITLSFLSGQAQTRFDNLEFKQFSTPEGLPNSMVHQVYQDRDGYIWISTFYGLSLIHISFMRNV